MSTAPDAPATNEPLEFEDSGLLEATQADLNIMFLLVSGYLVFFMQCGFCMVRVCAVWGRERNVVGFCVVRELGCGAV